MKRERGEMTKREPCKTVKCEERGTEGASKGRKRTLVNLLVHTAVLSTRLVSVAAPGGEVFGALG